MQVQGAGSDEPPALALKSCQPAAQVVNVLDDVHNPGLRETLKTFSQWPTIPQVRPPPGRPHSPPHTWHTLPTPACGTGHVSMATALSTGTLGTI